MDVGNALLLAVLLVGCLVAVVIGYLSARNQNRASRVRIIKRELPVEKLVVPGDESMDEV